MAQLVPLARAETEPRRSAFGMAADNLRRQSATRLPGKRQDGSYRFRIDTEDTRVPRLHIMSSSQPGLDTEKMKQIDGLKLKMAGGTFDYQSDIQISGFYHEGTDTFFLEEGHHRVSAALELAYETGNWSYFRKLMNTGYWDLRADVPPRRYRLTMRSSLFSALPCRSLISQITPSWSRLLFQ